MSPKFTDPRLTTWLCRRHLFAGQRVIAHFAGFRQPQKGRVGPRPPAGRIWVQLRPRQEIAARNRQGTVAVAATVGPSRHTQAPIQDSDRRLRTKPCRGWESTRPEQARPPAEDDKPEVVAWKDSPPRRGVAPSPWTVNTLAHLARLGALEKLIRLSAQPGAGPGSLQAAAADHSAQEGTRAHSRHGSRDRRARASRYPPG